MFNWFKREKATPSAPSAGESSRLPAAKDWSMIQINPDDPETQPLYSFSLGRRRGHDHQHGRRCREARADDETGSAV